MPQYLLYRSGILDVRMTFDDDGVYYEKRNLVNHAWEERKHLTSEEAAKMAAYYHMNPLEICDRIDEWMNQLVGRETVSTSWGAVYEKAEADDHLWVERQRKFPLDVVVVSGDPVAFISPSRENCSVLVKAGFEHYTPVKQWQSETVSPASYTVKHAGTFLIPMHDGVKLATEVWLPGNVDTPVPAILVRTPYGRMRYEDAYVNFVHRGYAVVIQDVRGREDSEGEWVPMHTEVEDGDDTLNWLAKQAWCNGRVGMIGASYGGYVQWAAAASGNPHLQALVSIVTAGSPFVDIPRKGGAFVSGTLAWTFAMVEQHFKPENMERDDWDDVLKIRPLQDIPKRALGLDVPFWNKWMAHQTDDAFWQASDWSRHKQAMSVPAMIVSGWYDDNGMGTTEALEVVADFESSNKKIILGPWMHNANTTRDIQGVSFGNNALRYDMDVYYQAWFDRKLKGIDNGIDRGAAAEYYDVGVNAWCEAETWPPSAANPVEFYLGSGSGEGILDRDAGREDHGTAEIFSEYVYDPKQPAPHLIDLSENEIGVPADYQDVEKRDDVLVFTTPILEDPIEVAGDVSVMLYASSSAKDTDWIVRISDVYPDGRSIKLADGVLRARFRQGFNKEVLLEPGQVEAYEIRTAKFANTFKRGHRIRLSITSSANDFIFPNTNTGKDPATDCDSVEATQRIYHSDKYPSAIKLSVLS
ncbi:CocE/NonD family hydrolase [Lentibacillus saliphilus]|uniref:CocE/NonD family hydrolase n=1 Tax=Lentibacillus saliphilus TaxID=2737028 RepID=UPI001C2F6A17